MPFRLHLPGRRKSPVADATVRETFQKALPTVQPPASSQATSQRAVQADTTDAPIIEIARSSSVGSRLPLRNLWEEAYNSLRENSGKLVGQFEQVILQDSEGDRDPSPVTQGKLHFTGSHLVRHANSSAAPMGSSHTQLELTALVSAKVKAFEEEQGFRIAGQLIKVQAGADRVVKFVMFAKDFVSSAVSIEPHAALAWAGICVFLPVCPFSPILFHQTHRDWKSVAFKPYVTARCRCLRI